MASENSSREDKFKDAVVVIYPNGDVVTSRIDKPAIFEEIQKLCGGDIQKIPGFTRLEGQHAQAWGDEDGKQKGYQINKVATHYWHKVAPLAKVDDHLVGIIVVLTGKRRWGR